MRLPSLFVVLLFMTTGCNDSNIYLEEEHDILSEVLNLPEQPFDYTPKLSAGVKITFPELEESIAPDALRNHQATLGRVLFYDKQLSRNNTISCASCHIQERAFSDNLRVSKGFEGVEGHRNTLALAVTPGFEISYGNMRPDGAQVNPPAFFSWDDSAFDLTEQSQRAITSQIEMGMTMYEVIERLSTERSYAILNYNAFQSVNIMEHHVLEALKVFMNAMSSVNSKFDKGLSLNLGDPFSDFSNFTDSENEGKRLFNRDCAACHHELHSFSQVATAHNGLQIVNSDHGKGSITNMERHMDVFKVPFLRNIELTAPYMHDGRFTTLEEVLEHYSDNIQDHPNLHDVLKDLSGKAKKFNYTESEKQDIIAYLMTLTDYEILNDERFSNPFK